MGRFSFKTFRGLAYRVTSYDTPLWALPNRRPGRWSHPDDRTIAQYCTLDAVAPLGEFVRHEDLREPPDAAEVRIRIWQLRLNEGAIVDLSSPQRAVGQRVVWEDLVADRWEPCQQLGREIRAEGGRGVVAPNAALPGSHSITVFGARSELSWSAEPTLAIQIPARDVVRGAPSGGLVHSVRYFGEDYPDDIELASVAHMLSATTGDSL